MGGRRGVDPPAGHVAVAVVGTPTTVLPGRTICCSRRRPFYRFPKYYAQQAADRQFRSLPVREQRILEAAIQSRLQQQPTTPTKAIKRLRPNLFADCELRVGDLRALYNVDEGEVVVLLVGRKVGNKLIVEGEEFHGHQDHPTEPSGNGPEEDTE